MQVRLHVQHCSAAVEARAWDAVGSTHAQLAAAASAARTAAHTGGSGAGPAGAGGVLRLGVAGVTSVLGSGLASVVQVRGRHTWNVRGARRCRPAAKAALASGRLLVVCAPSTVGVEPG